MLPLILYLQQRFSEIREMTEVLLTQEVASLDEEQISYIEIIRDDSAKLTNVWPLLKDAGELTPLELFATTMSESRTPISVTLGYSKILLLEAEGKLSEAQKESLNHIYVCADEMLTVIDILLYVAQKLSAIKRTVKQMLDLDDGSLTELQIALLAPIHEIANNLLELCIDWPNGVDLSEVMLTPNSIIDPLKYDHRSARSVMVTKIELLLSLSEPMNEEQKQFAIQLHDLIKALFEGPYQ